MIQTAPQPDDRTERSAAPGSGVSRRRFLVGTAAAAAAGAAVGAGVTAAVVASPPAAAPPPSGTSPRSTVPSAAASLLPGRPSSSARPGAGGEVEEDLVDLTAAVPFYGEPHPPGIATPPQRYAAYMTFDMFPGTTAADLQALLARWSAAIAQLTAGKPIGQVRPAGDNAVGADTGEALGLAPASLTVTVGLGPGLFDDRFGLAARRPALLAELPRLPSDRLDPAGSGGDLSLQACADDPQVTYHAVRNLARMVRSTVQTRWAVMGFGRASAGPQQHTPRNLLGFKDGTRNIDGNGDDGRFVWLRDADWMTGGTYQVVRKIQMNLETWDADRVSDQERVFGRTKSEGAPLGGTAEFDTPDFAKVGADGTLAIDHTAHIRLAAPENNGGIKILRRSYNYTDGITADGQLDAGLLFIAYMNDPGHFVTLQTRLGAADRLNEYIAHIGSGIFAVPPAPDTGHYLAEQLFG
jgi:deferrochelatase/peroxidase EfeB